MSQADWEMPHKPYDIREKTLSLACVIVRIVQFLQRNGAIGAALSAQLLKSGTSAGANYEEADDGSSPLDAREEADRSP